MIKTMTSVLLLMIVLSVQAGPAGTEAAEAAAIRFLELVDKGEYDRSYSTASAVLREEVTGKEWSGHLSSLRDPLGPLQRRALDSSEFHESLPDAPAGEYVIFVFDSSFQNSKNASELVALTKGSDGVWRVVGYYFG